MDYQVGRWEASGLTKLTIAGNWSLIVIFFSGRGGAASSLS